MSAKIVSSVIAQMMSTYLERTNLVGTMVQKAGIPGSEGCLDHTSMIWHKIQRAKENHFVLLALANMFGCIPHSFIRASLEFFTIPKTKSIFKICSYASSCQTSPALGITWHNGRISYVPTSIHHSNGGQRVVSVDMMSYLWCLAYMDDMMIITTEAPYTGWQENIKGSKMKFKAAIVKSP